MNNAKKFAGLTFILIFPIFVVWFLKSFGENKFSIPVFHQDASAISSDFCPTGQGQHYIPAFNLIDKEGKVLDEHYLENQYTVVSFFNSNCQEACQRLNNELLRLKGNFEDTPAVHIMSVTTNPEQDQPAALKAYAEANGLADPQWQFVTGERSTIEELIRCGFVMPVEETAPESLQLVLVDGQRRIRGYYGRGREEVDRLITEIKILLEE